ncbi:MAG: DUF2769 domain-containing protein [Candidatus Thorarchaeota archaeon]
MADIETWATDTFETKYKALMGGMSEADIKRSAEQVLHLCFCSKCPTNIETGEINAVYCTFGKSEMITERKDCLCKDCSITKTMSLRWDFYCIRGSAVQLSDL